MSDRSPAPWFVTPFIAAAVVLGIMGLEVMIDLGGWLLIPLILLLLTVLTVVIARRLTRQRTLPTLIGAVVAIVVMVPVFSVADDGERYLFPTPAALGGLGATIRAGVEHAATSTVPAPPAPGFTALITLGLISLFLAAEYLVVAWHAVASAGVLLLAPWVPAVLFQHRVSIVALMVAVALWLAVLALTHWQVPDERRPAYGGALVATVSTLAAVLLVAPLALGGPGWGMIPRIDIPGGANTATRLNLAIDLRNSLTTNSTSPVLVYESTGARPSAIKLYTLTDFDGAQWERENTPVPTVPATGDVLWPTPVNSWTDRERTRIEMQVLDLEETNLPLPPTPRVIDVEGGWLYDPERDEVVGDGVTARDARYSIETDPNLPVREELEAFPAGPLPGDAELDARYLAVAPAIDLARVEALAQDLTANETTRHGQALALQSYLRSSREFTYDTSVRPAGADAVSTFLDDREGYCIHFATTMVVMARSLDIPARMGHGFLPGTATDQGSYVVQGGDAHVWPEIWFPDQGWVRFEPTPATQTGAVPDYADPTVGENDEMEPQRPEVPVEVPEAPEEPDTPDTGQGMPGPQDVDEAAIPLWSWIAVAAAAVAAGVGLWLWRARSSARREREFGPEAAWDSLRTRLPDSFQWGNELTPYEAAEFVCSRLQAALPGAPATMPTGDAKDGPRTAQQSITSALTAMTALTGAVVDYRYAPADAAVDVEQLRAWTNDVATGAKTALQVSA